MCAAVHFVLCTGLSGKVWPQRVEEEKGSFAAAFQAAFEPL